MTGSGALRNRFTNSGIDWNDMLSLPNTYVESINKSLGGHKKTSSAPFSVYRRREPIVDQLYLGDLEF